MGAGEILMVTQSAADILLLWQAIAQQQLPITLRHSPATPATYGWLQAATPADSVGMSLIVLGDLQRPAKCLDVLALVRTNDSWRDVPIVLLSPGRSPAAKQEALSHGAQATLEYPRDYQGYLELARQLHQLCAA